MSSSGLLAGKVSLISGTARGMGLSHARAFLDQGARVVAFDRDTGDDVALQDEYGDDRVLICRGDVRSEDSWADIVSASVQKFGGLDILVNNAGICPIQRVEDVSEADYRHVIDVNQVGTFLGMRTVIPEMKERGGSIVNVASTAAMVGFADIFGYVASKWAVRGMTKAAALELANYGIRVNAVCPGDTDTPMLRNLAAADSEAAPSADELPFRRWASPEEVSAAVVFLASDGSSYVSGTEIVVDGAYTAR